MESHQLLALYCLLSLSFQLKNFNNKRQNEKKNGNLKQQNRTYKQQYRKNNKNEPALQPTKLSFTYPSLQSQTSFPIQSP